MLRFGGLILKIKCTFFLLNAFSLFLCYILLLIIVVACSSSPFFLPGLFTPLKFCFLSFSIHFLIIIFPYISLLSKTTPSSYALSFFPSLFFSFSIFLQFFFHHSISRVSALISLPLPYLPNSFQIFRLMASGYIYIISTTFVIIIKTIFIILGHIIYVYRGPLRQLGIA